jgi:hypothetical protein
MYSSNDSGGIESLDRGILAIGIEFLNPDLTGQDNAAWSSWSPHKLSHGVHTLGHM